MTFDPNNYDLSVYIGRFNFASGEWISIRCKDYAPESVNPLRGGRFHHIGTPAYYAASGISTARVELWNNASAPIPETHEVFSFPEGEYKLFDVGQFVDDHPEASGVLDPNSHTDGIRLRTALENISCSGVTFPSTRDDGGINASVWPLDGTPLTSGTFFRPYHRPR